MTVEDVEDLWCLRRLVEPGDLVAGRTTRLVKRARLYGRPDRGERIQVLLTIKAERVRLDDTLERLRITGTIVESSSEEVAKGSTHSLVVTPGNRVSVRKAEERLTPVMVKALRSSERRGGSFTLVAIDSREAGIGRVTGVRLQLYPIIQSGATGKYYQAPQPSSKAFYQEVAKALESVHQPGSRLILTGPGQAKQGLARHLTGTPLARDLTVVEGVDIAGEDGVRLALRSPKVREVIQESRLAKIAALLEEVVRRLSVGDPRITLGIGKTLAAARMGAVEAAALSDRVFELGAGEEEVIELMNLVEAYRGALYLVDRTTDLGEQVATLGGVVALLRFRAE